MSDEKTIEPVSKTVEVSCSVEKAFRIFTAGINTWWPLTTHSVGQADGEGCFFEEKLGGRIYETDNDGTVHLWGTVTAWEPPFRVVFSWHPGREASTAQEVEFIFIGVPSGTRVELEHRNWEILGDPALEIRSGYESGWVVVLESFVATCGVPTG